MPSVNRIQVMLNGSQCRLVEHQLLSAAMSEWAYQGDCFAVAINETFVPRSQYANTEIKNGDSIEIVSPLEGG